MDPIFFISLYLLVGVCSGFLGGLLGIGGGIVIVPVLSLCYDLTHRFAPDQTTVVAVATSLACIVFTSASAAWTQYRAGRVRWDLARRLVAFLLIGSLGAGYVGPLLPEPVFRALIGTFLAFVALVMLSNWQPHPTRRFPGPIGGAGIGLGGGLIAGLAGIAGGNVIVPTLVYFNTPIHNATATSSALGVPIALFGALGYIAWSAGQAPSATIGYVDPQAFVPIVLGAFIAARQGVRVAHRVNASRLKKAFGLLLVFVSARMLYSAII